MFQRLEISQITNVNEDGHALNSPERM